MNHRNLNDNKISIEAGIANGIIGKARKRGSLSQSNIAKIIKTYPQLNARWLLTGQGEMLNKPNFKYDIDQVELLKEIIIEKENKIDDLNREIGKLQMLIDILKKKK